MSGSAGLRIFKARVACDPPDGQGPLFLTSLLTLDLASALETTNQQTKTPKTESFLFDRFQCYSLYVICSLITAEAEYIHLKETNT